MRFFRRFFGAMQPSAKSSQAYERIKSVTGPEFDDEIRAIHDRVANTLPKVDIERLSTASRDRLSSAIENLYAAFGDCRPSDPFEFCDHCVSQQWVDHVTEVPLRVLSHHDLWTLSQNLIHTVGNCTDLKYFLPRLIEGAFEGATYDMEPLLQRCAKCGFENWHPAQREAVIEYLQAQIDADIDIAPAYGGIWDVDTIICGAASILRKDVASALLGRLLQDDDPTRRALAHYARHNGFLDHPPVPTNAYWDSSSEDLLAWFAAPDTAAALARALENA